jgi:VWFA-related protein
MKRSPLAFVLFCFALPLATLAQTTSSPNIRTGTQIVVVDVTVSDAQGNPVHNLQQPDFRVLENGDPQAVSHFEEHSRPPAAELAKAPAEPKLEPNVYTNFTLTREGEPVTLLVFDILNTPVEKQAYARRQLLTFLGTMKPGTPLALLSLTTHLSMLQSFTSDPKLLLAALSKQDNIQPSPILPDAIGTMSFSDAVSQMPHASRSAAAARQIGNEQTTQQNHLRAVYTLNAMNQVGHYLAGMPGRKNLIWFSGSFPAALLNSSGTLQGRFHATMNLLARSQVAVYPMDARGLTNTPLSDVSASNYALNGGAAVGDDDDQFSTRTADEHSTMRRMAKATGGKAYVNVNDLSQAIDEVLTDGSNYYTLVYTPTDKREDGSYRKISVRLEPGNYTLTYRDGYYSDGSASQPKSGPSRENSQAGNRDAAPSTDAMRAAMQRGAPTPSEIIFKALLVASPATSDKLPEGNTASPKSKPPYRLLTVAYAANPSDITMPERPDGTHQVALDFVALVYDREGQLFTQQSNPVNVFAKPAAIEQFLKEGVRYQQQIAVPAKGEYYLRVGIHDRIGDKVGAIEIPVASIATTTQQSKSPPGK